jgi:hypothetical protein
VCHDLKISNFEHPSTEVGTELEVMRLTPENSIGLLHYILRLSPVTNKRQHIGVEPALMAGQKLNKFKG